MRRGTGRGAGRRTDRSPCRPAPAARARSRTCASWASCARPARAARTGPAAAAGGSAGDPALGLAGDAAEPAAHRTHAAGHHHRRGVGHRDAGRGPGLAGEGSGRDADLRAAHDLHLPGMAVRYPAGPAAVDGRCGGRAAGAERGAGFACHRPERHHRASWQPDAAHQSERHHPALRAGTELAGQPRHAAGDGRRARSAQGGAAGRAGARGAVRRPRPGSGPGDSGGQRAVPGDWGNGAQTCPLPGG